MRYVKYQTSIAKTFDGVISDEEDIIQILTALKDKEITCRLRLSDGPAHDNVRILSVMKEKFEWRMVKNRSILKQTSLFANIAELEVNTDIEMSLHLKPEPSRWSLLDPDIIDPEV